MKTRHQLNYKHLYYFWTVAKEGHLTRVAAELRVSQSALSAQIKLLEDDLGHQLFLREKRSLKLTEVGRVILGYADGIFSLGNEMISALSTGEGQKTQQLRVGAVATLSRNFQENFLRGILETDDVRLVLESGTLEELVSRLALHKLHLVLSNRPVSASPDGEQSLHCRRVARQPVCLVGKPRRGSRRFQFPKDLSSVKLLVPGLSSDIRTSFDVLCQDLGAKPEIFAEVDDMAMLRLLARDSGCVALVPIVVVQDELRDGVLQKYCAVPKVYENFYAITAERRFQPEALKRLIKS